MAYYYVKSGGTATGDAGRATTQRTGSFATMGASTYYTDVYAVLSATTAVADGDFICVSDASANTSISVTTIGPFPSCTIISVSDTNADQYSAGAEETRSASGLTWSASTGKILVFYGMRLAAEDDLFFSAEGGLIRLIDCDLHGPPATQTGDNFSTGVDGTAIEIIDSVITGSGNATDCIILLSRGSNIRWTGGSIGSTTTATDYLAQSIGGGGGTLVVEAVDLSNIDMLGVFRTTTANSDETSQITLRNCKLPSGWSIGSQPNSSGANISIQNCTNADADNIMGELNHRGTCLTETTIVRTSGASVESVASSIAVDTEAEARECVAPFRFKLATLHDDFSSAKTLDVHIVHDSAGGGTSSHTQDDEVWVEWLIPNASDPGATFVSSGAASPFATPSDNATSTEAWTTTGITTPIYDKLSVTTDGLGGEGWAECYLCVGKPSIELFACPKVEVS